MKISATLFSLLLVVATYLPCKGQVVDSSINNICLKNASSVIKATGGPMDYADTGKSLPDVYISSKDMTQYLRMELFPGSSRNEFSLFEVGYVKNKKQEMRPSDYRDFMTESGIKLGLSRAAVIKIKGTDYKSEASATKEVIKYKINKGPFLQRYNMPVYYAMYTFINGVLEQFGFGFEYP